MFRTIKYLIAAITIGMILNCKEVSPSNSISMGPANETSEKINTPAGMVWIPGAVYERGASTTDKTARPDEKPRHKVAVDGFFMDITEVTNKQFKKFVEATDYVTVAERKIDWEEIKKQLPVGIEKPHDSLLQPGSLSFKCNAKEISDLTNYSQWWQWQLGVNWKHPYGKGSSIKEMDNYPVVHIAYEDALAYCKWANRRLPTEAEWELAARAGQDNLVYTWGNDPKLLNTMANTWQGIFPTLNTKRDGYEKVAPVKSFKPNAYGIYDMTGNVWEFTQDWYDYNYYTKLAQEIEVKNNPRGPNKSYNPVNPYAEEKTIRGGSFLCHDTYCSSYRVSARMATSIDTGAEHLGFRTVATPDMIGNSK
ncbi:formylglycine-generating enzyme family protein [Spongiivirga citrea]|uniref:SUMF1/EgtB/PvdO family nonheme iron enzyme n=1 Tax=Spongiivirga citrea TaxID=1481457 RepID=A0A6M0CIS5_9FLAO|nr:formylglycine-generating enzyme family protein [Spongiivirga citrea]NER17856.1 SUMF1/EgtB/PvdO family nonheme iron enzyme [Spongiivirga citrea]